ncbi:hypothetical protein BGZ95_010718, partial [Linnemannia exigua]
MHTSNNSFGLFYPNINTGRLDSRDFIDKAILTTLNTDVNMLNRLATDMLPTGGTIEYLAQGAALDDWSNGMTTYLLEVLNSMNPSELPPFDLYS